MQRGIISALLFAGCLAAASQTPQQAPAPAPPSSGQAKPASTQQTTPAAPASTRPAESNPFPDDTSNIPVVSARSMAADDAADGGEGSHLPPPVADSDPVRSPDDVAPSDELAGESSSSSSSGMDKLLPASGEDVADKHKRLKADEPAHVADAAEDLSVGEYYLERKNWRAALSRFESAMVLAPDNPDVFYGLAEAERHLGNFAEARKNYQTVVDYDPDSKHGKDARKALKDPEIANAKAAVAQQK